MRTGMAGLAGAGMAALGAVLLGEQPLHGVTVVVAAVLLGVAIAEVMVTVARRADGYLGASAALFTEMGLVGALYVETGHDLRAADPEAWPAVVLGAAVSAVWVRTAGRRTGRSHPST